MATKPKVGLIGLGMMGGPIAGHILRAGYQLFACDLDAERCNAAARLGAEIRSDTLGLAREVDIAIVIVGYDDEVREICIGDRGLINGMHEGGIIAICSTIKCETMTDLVEHAAKKGISVLDTPVTRAEEGAIAGSLLLLGGGDEKAFAIADPVFRTFCTDIFHLGPAGCGQVAKICNNLLLWISVVANCETIALAERCGLDKNELVKALMVSTGTNGTLHRWEKMTMPWVHKDLNIALAFAESLGVGLPMAGLTKQLFKIFNLPKARFPAAPHNG